MKLPGRRPVQPQPLEVWGGAGWAGDGRDVVPAEHWEEWARRDEVAAEARTRRVPLTAAAVTAGAGVSAWGATQIVDALAGSAAAGLAQTLVVAGAAVAVPVTRALLRDRIAYRWTRTWWAGSACAACWVSVAAGVGSPTVDSVSGMAAWLVLNTWAVGAAWFAEHEVTGDVDVEPTSPQLVVPAVATRIPQVDAHHAEAEAIERDWNTRVADGKRPLAPSSELVDREQLPQGWRWTIVLDRDEAVTRTALEADGVTADIALRLGTTSTHVIIEALEDDRREHLAQLTVVTRDVLAAGVPYRGPRYSRGAVPIGDYADGTPDAMWRLYDDTGVLCGLATGGQGSGKSNLLAAIGMAARRSGEWIVLFGDGDENGNSSHLLSEVAHDFARGPAEVLQQLEGLEAMAQVRGTLMGTLTTGPDGKPTPRTGPGQRAVAKILPCPAFPGIVWIVDEFYRLANDPNLQRVNFVDRVEAIVRIMRKYGGCVIVGTQSALGDDFDGNSALRGMLASGNSAVLRSKNKSEQGIVTDGFAPNQLPKGGGYAFLGEGDRRAMIRTEHPDGMPQWAPEVVRYGSPDSRTWAAFRRYRTVRQVDADTDYADLMAQLAAFDDAVQTGAPMPWEGPAARAKGEHDDLDDAPLSIGGFTVPTLADVIPFPQPVRDEPEPEPAVPDLSKDAQLVLDALQSRPGAWRSAELIKHTELSASRVSTATKELRGHGLSHLPTGGRGVHAAGPTPEINTEREVV